jgi:tetratricopeptide (TPR) repeat protein
MPPTNAQQAAAQAQRLLRSGRFRQALAITTALHRSLPDTPPIAALHAEALLQVGMPRAAAAALDPILASPILGTQHPELATALRVQRARAASDLGRPEDAVDHLRAALETRPDWPEALRDLGERLIDLGRPDEADRVLAPHADPAGTIDPGIGLAIARLRRTVGRTDEAAAILERLVEAPDPHARADAWFMLGACREQLGDPAGAFEAYRRGNAARTESAGNRPPVDPGVWESRGLEALRDAGPTPDPPTGSARIVLIVGVPRSGTSLVEQILAAHPRVGACGESQALPWVVSRLGPGGIGPDRASAIYREELEAAASRPGAEVLTDKNPMNLFLLGMAARIVPGVRVVRLRRDPRDVCLSCFASPLKADHAYARDLDDCRRFVGSADRVMDAAAGVFGAAWHEVVYEDLVRDPEPAIRALLSHAGLEFDERCLHPEREARVTRTISRDQVRSEINDASVGRWRRFAEHFEGWDSSAGRPVS